VIPAVLHSSADCLCYCIDYTMPLFYEL